jgi:hypothetical protein
MDSPVPADNPGQDLLYAWALAESTDVGTLPGDDEQAADRVLSEHLQPDRLGRLVKMLVDRLEASTVRLQAVADSARSRHRELTAEGESPELTHPYLIAVALAGRGLAVIGDGGTSPSKDAEARVESAPAGEQLADGRTIAWVMRLPQIDPPFAQDQRRRDGCMMPPLSWLQRMRRQLLPRHDVRDCCHYHRQDFHAIAAVVNTAYRQLRRSDLRGDDLDELRYKLVGETRLSEDERTTALMLLDPDCGIQIWRPPGERHWTYTEGRHRARALMDAGVRRILITATDDRRFRD